MSTLAQDPKTAFVNNQSVNNKAAVNPNSNFIGAGSTAAVSIGTALSNFYTFLKQQAFLKAAETKNVLSAAQNQASAMIQQGKKAMMGAFFQGGALIASGVVGVGTSAYASYKAYSANQALTDVNARAPGILNDVAETRIAGGDKYNTGLTEQEFNNFIKDPRTAPDGSALNARLKNHNFTSDQETRLNDARQQFNAGTAPLQEGFKTELNNLNISLDRGREIFGYLARGLGDFGKGREDALAAKDQAAQTQANAAGSLAQSAISAIEQFASQVANLIEALYRTIGALAMVNK